MGFEFTSDKETNRFLQAAWPSKVLKGKEGILMPLGNSQLSVSVR